MQGKLFYENNDWDIKNIHGYVQNKKTVKRSFQDAEMIVKFQDYGQPIKFTFQTKKHSEINLFIGLEDFFSRLSKSFGFNDYEIGIKEFDKKFLIKGNNIDWLKTLFKNNEIYNFIYDFSYMNIILGENDIGLRLEIIVPDWMFDEDKINRIYTFFIIFIKELYKLGIF